MAGLARASVRPEVILTEAPTPTRLAPFAVALDAEVRGDDDTPLAEGRLVVLHDPAGQDVWQGTTRCVAYAKAPLEADMGLDPMLPAVGWSWLTDALALTGATFLAAGGTVTRVTSERFGALAEHPDVSEVEVRASWSPVGDDLGPHLCAFAELLCTAAGLPPTPAGVTAIPVRRRR